MMTFVCWIAGASARRVLSWSAAPTIVGLMLMVWSMVQPTPQGHAGDDRRPADGTIAFALYGVVLLRELRAVRHARRETTRRVHDVPSRPVPGTSSGRPGALAAAAHVCGFTGLR